MLGAVGILVVVGGGIFLATRKRPTPASPVETPTRAGDSPRTDAPGASAWKQELALAKKAPGFDWDYESAPARALVSRLLTRAAPRFGNGQVKELPDDERIELRGTYGGSPIRFSIWMAFGSFRAIEMHCENRVGMLVLERDPEKKPTTQDSSDPWAKNETRREFLRGGIFVEGRDDLKESLAAWGRIPASTQTIVLDAMDALDVRMVILSGTVSLNVNPRLGDLDDPVGYMESAARVLERLKNAVAQGDQAPAMGGGGPIVRIGGNVVINGVRLDPGVTAPQTCAYCGSLFVLAETNGACPRCGAQATA